MDGQSYLNEISMANRPAPKSKMNFMKSKFFLVGAIGVVGLILMALIGAIVGGNKADIKEQTVTLKVRLDNISGVVKEYQPSIKSSVLRSNSASLYSVMSNTSRELGEYLEITYNFKDKSIPERIENDESAHRDELYNELFNAEINGLLDRTFTYNIIYEISLITTMERRIQNAAGNDTLKGIMETSIESLTNIYDSLNNYSETSNSGGL